jgi:ABC-type phosphate/phosphonate transport system substrate-binding protein
VGVWSDDPKMGTGAWSDPEFEKTGSKFRVLGVSDPIPNDAFAVRETFYTENPMLVFRMMESLIGMSEGPKEDQVLKKVFDIDGLVTATSRHYDSVKELQELVGKP